MNTVTRFALSGFIGLALALPTQAGELVHSFVNPSFGGNPLNGNYLLSSATAQNSHKAHPKTTTSASGGGGSSQPNSATQFAEQVDRLVMSSLANRLVTKAFGVGSGTLPASSTFDTGVNTVTVEDTGNGTRVTIVDNKTGGRSVITIPNY